MAASDSQLPQDLPRNRRDELCDDDFQLSPVTQGTLEALTAAPPALSLGVGGSGPEPEPEPLKAGTALDRPAAEGGLPLAASGPPKLEATGGATLETRPVAVPRARRDELLDDEFVALTPNTQRTLDESQALSPLTLQTEFTSTH